MNLNDPMTTIMDAYENPLSDEQIADFPETFLSLIHGVIGKGLSEREDIIIELGLRIETIKGMVPEDHPALVLINQNMDEITALMRDLRDKQKRIMTEIKRRQAVAQS